MFIKETLARESGLWPGITADSDQTVCYNLRLFLATKNLIGFWADLWMISPAPVLRFQSFAYPQRGYPKHLRFGYGEHPNHCDAHGRLGRDCFCCSICPLGWYFCEKCSHRNILSRSMLSCFDTDFLPFHTFTLGSIMEETNQSSTDHRG